MTLFFSTVSHSKRLINQCAKCWRHAWARCHKKNRTTFQGKKKHLKKQSPCMQCEKQQSNQIHIFTSVEFVSTLFSWKALKKYSIASGFTREVTHLTLCQRQWCPWSHVSCRFLCVCVCVCACRLFVFFTFRSLCGCELCRAGFSPKKSSRMTWSNWPQKHFSGRIVLGQTGLPHQFHQQHLFSSFSVPGREGHWPFCNHAADSLRVSMLNAVTGIETLASMTSERFYRHFNSLSRYGYFLTTGWGETSKSSNQSKLRSGVIVSQILRFSFFIISSWAVLLKRVRYKIPLVDFEKGEKQYWSSNGFRLEKTFSLRPSSHMPPLTCPSFAMHGDDGSEVRGLCGSKLSSKHLLSQEKNLKFIFTRIQKKKKWNWEAVRFLDSKQRLLMTPKSFYFLSFSLFVI